MGSHPYLHTPAATSIKGTKRMRTVLLVLVCFFALPTSVLAADLSADAAYGVKHAQERVITLPQDQGKWYVSLFGDPTDLQYQRLQKWFQSHSGLTHLRGQVHYNEYSSKSTRYQRYAKSMPGLPCVRVQNSKGVVTSEFWSKYIPLTGEALFNGIKGDLRDGTSWGMTGQRNRLRCRPKPTPPAPLEPPTPPVEPIDNPPNLEPEPEPESEKSGFPWLLALTAAIIGGGVGVGQGFKGEHLDSPARSVPKVS